MVGPLGGAVGSPAAATTEDEDDVDGGPPWGVLSIVQYQPQDDVDGAPPGGAIGRLTIATTKDGDTDGGPPWGVLAECRQQPPLKMKTSKAAPLTSMVICSEFCKKDVGSNK
jgi:hypothetical protein